MGGEGARGEHCGDMEGRKQVEWWGRLVAERGETACSVVCLLYKRVFGGGGTGKHGARQALFSVLHKLLYFIATGLCLPVSVRIEMIAKRSNGRFMSF